LKNKVLDILEFFTENFITLFLVVSLVFLPMYIIRHYYEGRVEAIKAMRETIVVLRSGGEPCVLQGVGISIIEVNGEIAEMKHWDKTLFDWVVPDRVHSIEPLKFKE